MKTLLAVCMAVAVTLAWAADKPVPGAPAATVVKGEVLEVRDVESYTYLRLKTKDGEVWAAVGRTAIAKGATVTIEDAMVMRNFESKAMKRTFPTLVLGTLGGAAAGTGMAAPHPGAAAKAETADVRVPKATGANARTVAEVVTKSAELKDKPVVIRGKIVKFTPAVMGKNWLHLRDGSGSAKDNTNDIVATTASEAKIGDIVTLKGVVRTEKNFGSGYSYRVIIEEATLQQ